jgi:putative transposase
MGLYKTELIHRRGPWRTAKQVELAIAAWVDGWNRRRLHGASGNLPPVEYEQRYHDRQAAAVVA